jgi:hypothetical protein
MGHARLGRCDRRNLSGIKVDAMAEYGPRRPPLGTPQNIVVSAFCDAAVIDDQRSGRPASQSAESRRVDEETSDAERVGVAVHKTPPLQEHQRMEPRNNRNYVER